MRGLNVFLLLIMVVSSGKLIIVGDSGLSTPKSDITIPARLNSSFGTEPSFENLSSKNDVVKKLEVRKFLERPKTMQQAKRELIEAQAQHSYFSNDSEKRKDAEIEVEWCQRRVDAFEQKEIDKAVNYFVYNVIEPAVGFATSLYWLWVLKGYIC